MKSRCDEYHELGTSIIFLHCTDTPLYIALLWKVNRSRKGRKEV